MDNAVAIPMRDWIYVSTPTEMECGECPRCGKSDYLWSTYKKKVWCKNCQSDVTPSHWGILDGPILVSVCELLGIRFDAIDLLTGTVTPFNSPQWPSPFLKTNEC